MNDDQPKMNKKEQYIRISKDGNKFYHSDREMTIRHRDDGPAAEWANGYKSWYINGKLHREDGPAVENVNGRRKEWYINGKLHREDGPAFERANGGKCWYINGKLHREDDPAVETVNGDKSWYINGERHREDGPAIEYANGNKLWFLNDNHLTEEEFNTRMNPIELTLDEIAEKFGISVDKLKIKK